MKPNVKLKTKATKIKKTKSTNSFITHVIAQKDEFTSQRDKFMNKTYLEFMALLSGINKNDKFVDSQSKLFLDQHINRFELEQSQQMERIKLEKESTKNYTILDMKRKVSNYANDLWIPGLNLNFLPIDERKHDDMCISRRNDESNYIRRNFKFDDISDSGNLKSMKIKIIFNETQKKIVQEWMTAYLKMFNETLRFIKYNLIHDKLNFTLDWMKVRGKLINIRNNIISESGKLGETILVHDIDYSIKLACSCYKTNETLRKRGYIKHYRVRYWKENKKIKIVDLIKDNFKSGSIRKTVLGNVLGYYNGKKFEFDTINHDCRLIYSGNEYYLMVPDKCTQTQTKKTKIISIDPGVRTFLTGISSNEAIEIGKKLPQKILTKKLNTEKVITKMNKIDKLNKTGMQKIWILNKLIHSEKRKGNPPKIYEENMAPKGRVRKEIIRKIIKKTEKKNNKKVKNIVNETHWKAINYLTSEYSEILIGNLSTKDIVSNNNNLTSNVKNIALSLRLFEFKQKLKYKCNNSGVKYKCANEYLTSKMCSICGNIKYDLGSNKEYNCTACNNTLDRDINGARMIYLKNVDSLSTIRIRNNPKQTSRKSNPRKIKIH